MSGGSGGGLMVSALVSGSNGPGSSPNPGHCVVLLGKTPISHSEWVLANLMLGGVTQRWTSIPSRGGRNTPSCFMLQKQEISAGLMGHLARMQAYLYLTFLLDKEVLTNDNFS